MDEVVTTTQVLCVHPSGVRSQVTIQVGRPYLLEDGDAACPVALLGLHDRLHDVHGVDSLQALALALALVRKLLGGFVSNGGQVLLPDGSGEYPLQAFDVG